MSTPDANGWFGIASAPRDGTPFRAWCIEDHKECEHTCHRNTIGREVRAEWVIDRFLWPWDGHYATKRRLTHWRPDDKPPVQP